MVSESGFRGFCELIFAETSQVSLQRLFGPWAPMVGAQGPDGQGLSRDRESLILGIHVVTFWPINGPESLGFGSKLPKLGRTARILAKRALAGPFVWTGLAYKRSSSGCFLDPADTHSQTFTFVRSVSVCPRGRESTDFVPFC